MKILLCGSRTFLKEMKRIAETLNNLGHETVLPPSYNFLSVGVENLEAVFR